MADGAGGSRLSAATDRIRETAKWMTVSLAAIGGLLAAGSQLTSLGSLPVFGPRFWVAIIALFTAMVGAALILLAAVWTATTPALTLRSLATVDSAAARWVSANRQILLGFRRASALSAAYDRAARSRLKAFNAYQAHTGTDSRETAQLAIAVKRADAELVAVDKIASAVLEAANFEQVAHRWRWARLWLILGGLIAAVGIGSFAWAANPPADAAASSAEPNVLTSPQARTLHLTTAGQQALATELGCQQDTLHALQLGTTPAGPDLLVLRQGGCRAVRFVLAGDRWGWVS